MLKKIVDYCNKNNGSLYVYGAGAYGRRIGVWLDENGYDWKGFVETQKRRDKLLDKPVFGFSDFTNEYECSFIVCVSVKYQDEIESQIKASGIGKYIIVTPDQIDEVDKFNKYQKEYSTNSYVNILLYHRVIDLSSDPQLLAVDVKRFEQHIKYLKENYHIIRLEDDWASVKEKSIVITFDDGYVDNYLNALPLLEQYQTPATVFVSTGNLNTDNEMWWDELEALFLLNNDLPQKVEMLGKCYDLSSGESRYQSYLEAHKVLKEVDSDCRCSELARLERALKPVYFPRPNYRMMTSEELIKLSQSEYITIGGHTVSHCSLAKLGIEKQRWEIETSKMDIEEIIGGRLEVFSYPFGSANDFTEETIAEVKEVGYKKACVVKAGIVNGYDNQYKLPRNLIRNWDLDDFKRNINSFWSLYG